MPAKRASRAVKIVKRQTTNANIAAWIIRGMLGVLSTFGVTPQSFADTDATPITRFEFEISKASSKITEPFKINEEKSYIFAIQFEYHGNDDLYRVLKLAGDGPGGRNEGVPFPIHLQIDHIDETGRTLAILFDETILTVRSYAHNFFYDRPAGSFSREITTFCLNPGQYLLEADTVRDVPALSGTPTYLLIDYGPGVRYGPCSR
jgi:hypothetical protein